MTKEITLTEIDFATSDGYIQAIEDFVEKNDRYLDIKNSKRSKEYRKEFAVGYNSFFIYLITADQETIDEIIDDYYEDLLDFYESDYLYYNL